MRRIGIYNPYLATMGGGEKVCLALASVLAANPDNEVTLITYKPLDLSLFGKYFDLDVSQLHVQVVPMDTPGMQLIAHLPIPGAIKNFCNDLKVHAAMRRAKYDIFVNNCYKSNLPGPARRNVYMCMFPQRLDAKGDIRGPIHALYRTVIRLLYRASLHPTKRHAVYTYDTVIANSLFSQGYVTRYWGVESQVLYPICDNMADQSIHKAKKILTVGRFFANDGVSHHKRHDLLIQTFAAMKDLQEAGWELHVVGSVAEDVKTLRYVLDLIRLSENLPVSLHFNLPFKDLRELYNEATVYWHATGYGANARLLPETQEHFGITTVEAMSAGAIPIVINSAGQKESVQSGVTGFLWSTPEQLMDYTRQVVAATHQQRSTMSQAARAAAATYGKAAFSERVTAIFDELVR